MAQEEIKKLIEEISQMSENEKKELEKKVRKENLAKQQLHCPICGSLNVRKIGTAERSASFLLVGFGSGKVGKQYICNDCKYKW